MASLKKNVEQLRRARGLSQAELGSRIGFKETDFAEFLQSPPDRKETILRKLSQELLVPDFYLFSQNVSVPESAFPDFRLSHPSRSGYERETLRWMDLATSIRAEAEHIAPASPSRRIKHLLPTTLPVAQAAQKFRDTVQFSHQEQLALPDARSVFAVLRQRIESLNVFVLQLSFPDKDGAGFCLAGALYDVIVLNTRKQSSARRLFTLAHEVYHCALGQSGVSDPLIINNAIERKCNQFAVHFLAPADLVRSVANTTISTNTFRIDELSNFSKAIKLSMHASVLRLVETGLYSKNAVGAWQQFIRGHGDPEAPKKGGGRRQEEWKYKLAKYGFKFAEVFGEAKSRGAFDDYELYRLSGIKPKYQSDYIQKAAKARPGDAEDDEGGEDA